MKRSWTPITVHTQAAEPSPRASTLAISNTVSTRTSGPPNRFGFSRCQMPASQRSAMVSAGSFRAALLRLAAFPELRHQSAGALDETVPRV